MERKAKGSWSNAALALSMAFLMQAAAMFVGGIAAHAADKQSYALTTQFSYKATVTDVPAGTRELRIWLPIPSDSEWQKVQNLKVEAAVPYQVTQEHRYGNRMVYLDVKNPPSAVTATVQFTVNRKSLQVLGVATPVKAKPIKAKKANVSKPDMKLLAPDVKVPVGGKYGDLAQQVTMGKTTPEGKMRAIFDHVIATMSYDYKKESPEYGQGDVAFVCDYKKGNCSDLHSYMISLARSAGVPTVLEYGFPIAGIPLPNPLPQSGTIGGYHCWVWFQDGARGWVPVDASDARKWLDADKPARKEFLFGNLIPERSSVAMSRGRDITLEPPQKAAPLNYFIYPYAEADGQSVKAGWTLTYQLPGKP